MPFDDGRHLFTQLFATEAGDPAGEPLLLHGGMGDVYFKPIVELL